MAGEWDRPERAATARPEGTEPPAAHAVGVGPGTEPFLTARAERLLATADVVVGFETVVSVVEDVTEATLLTCGYDDQEETLSQFGESVAAGANGVAVLMGDPNVSGYQFLGRIERVVAGPVRVVPGISSVQVAASRARTPLEQSTVVSLHRRGSIEAQMERLVTDAGKRHLLVLPRPYDTMPGDIASHLLDSGVDPALTALVYERLTMSEESVTEESLAEMARDGGTEQSGDENRFSDLSVLVVRANRPTDISAPPTEDES